MAHAPIVQDRTARRTAKALTIVARQDCEPLDNGGWIVRDVATGSGAPHIVAGGHCDCPDHTRRASYCKHLQAVALEERSLAQYAATWNARSAEARVALDDLPGNFLDSLSDEYRGPYGSDGWPQPRPTCPECGAELVTRSYYVGGKGYTAFLCCTRDAEHQALPA